MFPQSAPAAQPSLSTQKATLTPHITSHAEQKGRRSTQKARNAKLKVWNANLLRACTAVNVRRTKL